MKKRIFCLFLAVVFAVIFVPTIKAEEKLSLPENYIAVEYVESHGQEWIDTGFVPTANTRSEVDFQITVESPSASMGIFGAYRSSRHQVFYTVGTDCLTYGVGKGAAYTSPDTERHCAVLDAKNACVTVDGVSLASDNGNDFTSANAAASIYIFGAHQPSDYSSYTRIYEAKIYENDVLIHHYVPCYSEQNFEYGMYDTVENEFFGNSSGAGMLTGPENRNDSYIAFRVPDTVSLKVYSGFSEKTSGALSFSHKESSNGTTVYYYSLTPGKYHFVSSGTGYYILHKNFIVTNDDILNGGKIIDADPHLTSANKKYDYARTYSKALFSFTDEVLCSELMSLEALLKEFPGLLDTPAFSPEKAFAQFTSQQEMEEFISAHDSEDDNMHIYTIGKTGEGKKIYLTVHSKGIPDEKSVEDLAKIVKSNGKPTVCIFGLIHGLEPSGGEGPLSLIKALSGEYGDKILEKVNIIIIPWINGDGAERYSYGTPTGCSNLNRYQLMVDYPEVQAVHLAYNMFLPEVVISAHEKGFNTNGAVDEIGTLIDASLDISTNLNNTEEMRKFSKDMMKWVIETSLDEGFRMDRHEQANVSGQYPIIDTNYFGLRGSISFLVEVPGIRSGKDFYKRRVAAQFVSAKNIIQYVYENPDKVLSVVASDRAATIEKGETFSALNLLTLRHGKNSTPSWKIPTPIYNLTDGSIYDATAETEVIFWEEPLAVRARPTAYVIPADIDNIDYILQNSEYNAIEYYKISSDSFVSLKKYEGTVTSASCENEELYNFKNGAYVFPMNQLSANVLAMLMEPDVYKTDSFAISLAQGNKISVNGIYRCEQNLICGKIPVLSFGDANFDSKTNILDANLIRRYAAKLAVLDEKQLVTADVNGDGNVNVLDANLIRRYAAKLIDKFPAENH